MDVLYWLILKDNNGKLIVVPSLFSLLSNEKVNKLELISDLSKTIVDEQNKSDYLLERIYPDPYGEDKTEKQTIMFSYRVESF